MQTPSTPLVLNIAKDCDNSPEKIRTAASLLGQLLFDTRFNALRNHRYRYIGKQVNLPWVGA